MSGKFSKTLIALGALWTFSAVPPLAHCVRLFFNRPAPRTSLIEMLVLWSLVLLAGPLLARGSKWGRALMLVLLPLIGLDVLSWLAMCILEENHDLPLISFAIFLIVLSVATSIILVKYRKEWLALSGRRQPAKRRTTTLLNSLILFAASNVWSTHSFYHADGNGNITCLISSAATPSVVASYKYDPYGRTVSATGSLADANLYRFSSKEFVASCGLYYYLYRFYDSNLQRWLNRDPIEELDGINLYEFVKNSPPNHYDPTGLFGDGNNGQCLKGKSKGHSDFYGHNCFDFPAEDHGSTGPWPVIGTPGNHFQDIGQSLRQARAAIAACDANAFARAMHRVQDCFSHAAYSWEPPYCWGHAGDRTAPDKSNVAWDRANRMTHRLVDEYIRKCGLPNDHIPIEGRE